MMARNVVPKKTSQSEYLTLLPAVFYKNIVVPDFRKNFEQSLYKNLSSNELLEILDYIHMLTFDWIEFRKRNLIKVILHEKFFDNLVSLVQKVDMSFEVCSKIIEFYESIIHYVPHCEISYEKMQVLFEVTLDRMSKLGILELDSHLFERMSELIDILERKDYYISKIGVPYIYLDLYPSAVDLYNYPAVSPLILNGSYKDSSHYLDINFKVLKEDFFSYVREGLCAYRKETSEKQSNRSNYFYIYENIKSKTMATSTKSRLCHLLQFSDNDKKMLKHENWEFSKKFMIGSLLLFSRNNFVTFFVATVEENLSRFSRGDAYIKVYVVGNPHQFKSGVYYTMLESKAFFEPYYQSLRILQEMDPYVFPLGEEIILSSKETPTACISSELSVAMESCLNESDLNLSQKVALHASLKHKFTLIQGPPGTGKSYLTRKIISILASDTSDKRPILVVCMRNRAVDIVLEPLIESGFNIMRFGRTESETLLSYTFGEFRRKYISDVNKPCTKCLKKKLTSIRKVLVCPENVNNEPLLEEATKLDTLASAALKLCYDYHIAHILLSKKVKIIGATTTGAAKRNKLINELKPKAVIIEEAAEMLEAYAITSLPQACDRVILIGDHQQLQPQPSMHHSAQKYNLKMSLFERLLNNGKKFYTLTEQHRMRSEISGLVSPLIYKNLSNHNSVYSFPDIKGMGNNLFFMKHENSEMYKSESSSYYNPYEGDILLSLANYLVHQGYGPYEITILAAYSAQQIYISQNIKNYRMIQDIEIQTIDNYQGNENKIVLLSLVRSNGNTIGFLSMANRINVAFTRAQIGLYMIGNINTLTRCAHIWRDIHKILLNKGSIGSAFPFSCKTHKTKTLLSTPKEIDNLTLVGCSSVCGKRLDCGHDCKLKCHESTPDIHKRVICQQPCQRKRKCGNHICKKLCHEECEDCNDICFLRSSFEMKCSHSVTVIGSLSHILKPCNKQRCLRRDTEQGLKLCSKNCEHCLPKVKFILSCGHEASLMPKADLTNYKCKSKCNKFLCFEKHARCQLDCHTGPCPPCTILVKKYIYCSHSFVPCSLFNIQPLEICPIRLIITYNCGHKYQVQCGEHKSNTNIDDKCKNVRLFALFFEKKCYQIKENYEPLLLRFILL